MVEIMLWKYKAHFYMCRGTNLIAYIGRTVQRGTTLLCSNAATTSESSEYILLLSFFICGKTVCQN